ncbi:unnamed protein product [Cylicocyclus nassatus]|uniref:Uncharacterized protein n=1 Tax=Cylicocyclus nassatus TaxID=53992 RepID=A0AA36H5B4_CYLNA|nr:unnamed protein product [Cylicocyclus nassatus]
MSTYWLKNFVGLKQSDFELLKVPNPSTEFCIHVTLRSVQTGALLGSVLGPLSAAIFDSKNANSKMLTEKFISGGTNGALIGAAMGPILTYLALRDLSTVRLYDRCYRLRFDKQALWQDRTCFLSAAVGYLTSGSLGLSRQTVNLMVSCDLLEVLHLRVHNFMNCHKSNVNYVFYLAMLKQAFLSFDFLQPNRYFQSLRTPPSCKINLYARTTHNFIIAKG